MNTCARQRPYSRHHPHRNTASPAIAITAAPYAPKPILELAAGWADLGALPLEALDDTASARAVAELVSLLAWSVVAIDDVGNALLLIANILVESLPAPGDVVEFAG